MSRRRPSCVWSLLCVSLGALACAPRASSPPTHGGTHAGTRATSAASPSASADPLASLNTSARSSYRITRKRILAGLGPIVLVEGDHLVLLRDGTREQAVIRTGVYHAEKSIAHLALALEAIVGDVDGPLDDQRLGELRDLRARALAALDELSAGDYSAAAKARQREIVTSFTRVIDAALAARSIAHADYLRSARAVAPLLLENADDAARAELDAIHAQVTAWRQALGPAAWSHVYVVVFGSHMARDQSLELQYFERLLGEPTEGGHVVFAENVGDESKALDLLATHVIDARLGESYFGDPARMHRDLLSDAARKYLQTLLP